MRQLIVILIALVAGMPLSAQTQKELSDKKAQLLEEMEVTRGQLSRIKQKASSTKNEMATLQRQISIREELVATMTSEIALLDEQIAHSRSFVEALQRDIDTLKANYAEIIYRTYVREKTNSNLSYVLNAEGLAEAWKRLGYLNALNSFRLEQGHMILAAMETLEEEVAALEEARAEKAGLLSAEQDQQAALQSDRSRIESSVSELKKQEQRYLAEIRNKQKQANQIDKQIEALIVAAQKKAAKPAATNTTTGTMALTPEMQNLAKAFAENKGKLPWPVERGTLIRGYGNFQDPVTKTILPNRGLHLATQPESSVRAVFDGEVVSIIEHPQFKRAVIVSHGEFYTIYMGLNEVEVREGEKVSTKQSLGKAYTEEKTGITQIQFQVRQGSDPVDPSFWLAKK